MQKTTAEDFYEAIQHLGAGSLYYLTRKEYGKDEFIFEPVIVDPKDKTLTINILKRVMANPNFIAFPGTPEAYEFMQSDVAISKNKE